MRKIRICLGDLNHNRHFYNYGVPLNVGYIAATLDQRFGNAVEHSIYKFADDLISALKTSPDILALSNYGWNVNLNRVMIKIAKDINPDILIVMGGPGIGKLPEEIKEFLTIFPIDMYVINDGEVGFCEIIEYILGKWPCSIKETIFRSGITLPNTAYLENETKRLILGGPNDIALERDMPFPSPWLSGILDSFLNESSFPLSPLIQTNRGCPYSCTFCHEGADSFRKIRKFDLDTVIEELRYIFKKAKYKFQLSITDSNFGIFQRDITIAEEIRRLSDKYKNVTKIYLGNTKNQMSRNIEISKIFGSIGMPDFPVQSFSEKTLDIVKRKNIKLDFLPNFLAEVKSNGQEAFTDLLVGMPGETKESQIDNIRKVYDIGFHFANVGDVRLLRGSRMREADYMKKHGIESGFRVQTAAYGEYGGVKVIEYEECIRKTNTMSTNDFLDLRLFIAHEYLLNYFDLGGRPLLDFSKKNDLHPVDLISYISRKPPKEDYPHLSKYMEKYTEKAKSEWFESEEHANEYYLQDEVFRKIMKEGFEKLNYEYAANLILNSDLREEFMNWVGENIINHLPEKRYIVNEIVQFCIHNIYRPQVEGFQHIIEISKSSVKELADYLSDNRIGDIKQDSTVKIKFETREKKRKFIQEEIKRHGGKNNLSLAIQVMIMKNNKILAMDPPVIQS